MRSISLSYSRVLIRRGVRNVVAYRQMKGVWQINELCLVIGTRELFSNMGVLGGPLASCPTPCNEKAKQQLESQSVSVRSPLEESKACQPSSWSTSSSLRLGTLLVATNINHLLGLFLTDRRMG